jgi:triacylglycerol lipase
MNRPVVLACLVLAGSGLVACSGAADGDASSQAAETASAASTKKTAAGGQLTADFRGWLTANGYGSYDFARDDVVGGSFGGRSTAGETLKHRPIVFVHGNTDSALGTGAALTGYDPSPFTGWTPTTTYFLAHGYTMAEMYGTTWGPADTNQTQDQEHTRAYVERIRTFMQAVMAYTGSSTLDVVGHSMGVTLARGAIYGGTQVDSAGSYSLGASLGSKVGTFVGISGANQGLVACYELPEYATCSDVDGFYPGYLLFGAVTDLSTYMANLHKHAGTEATSRFAIFSTADELIGYGGLVYGQYTSRLEKETGEVRYDTSEYGHFGTKDETTAVQYDLITTGKATGLTKP